jgi:hypothetical protein
MQSANKACCTCDRSGAAHVKKATLDIQNLRKVHLSVDAAVPSEPMCDLATVDVSSQVAAESMHRTGPIKNGDAASII